MSDELPAHGRSAIAEYTERCGCGRIVITAEQAHAHTAWCDEMPDESQLLAETNHP